jgi:hypothetical protein
MTWLGLGKNEGSVTEEKREVIALGRTKKLRADISQENFDKENQSTKRMKENKQRKIYAGRRKSMIGSAKRGKDRKNHRPRPKPQFTRT